MTISYYEKINGEVRCIDDELPFELPAGWAWDRIGNCCIVNPRNKLDDNLDVSFIPMPCIREGYSNAHTSEVRKWADVKTGFTHFQENDVGVAKITPCFENRKSAVLKGLVNGYGAGTTELHIIRSIQNLILPEYILLTAKTNSFIEDGINAFSGAVGQKRIGKEFIAGYLFPIPPCSEQCRIFHTVETLYKWLDDIDASIN